MGLSNVSLLLGKKAILLKLKKILRLETPKNNVFSYIFFRGASGFLLKFSNHHILFLFTMVLISRLQHPAAKRYMVPNSSYFFYFFSITNSNLLNFQLKEVILFAEDHEGPWDRSRASICEGMWQARKPPP